MTALTLARETPLSLSAPSAAAFSHLQRPSRTPRLILISHTGSRVGRRLGAAGLAALAERAGDGAPIRTAFARAQDLPELLTSLAASPPDAIAVLGGDGTARTALEVLTPLSVPVIPLPGGTLNRLARKVHGTADPVRALRRAIQQGSPRLLAGARIGPHRFFVASGYGPAMRLQEVRELLRRDGPRAAMAHLTVLSSQLFGHGLGLDGLGNGLDCAIVSVGPLHRAFGLAPPVQSLPGAGGLQAAAARWSGWAGMIGLAPLAVSGLWPMARHTIARSGDSFAVSAAVPQAGISALLDGEAVHLDSPATITFDPACGLVWAAGSQPD